MKSVKLLLQIVILLFLFACSASTSLYESDIPLTDDSTKAQNSDLKVNIPQGWFTAEDNDKNKIDLWLIKNDYSATISFIPIIIDKKNEDRYGNSDLSKIVEYSKLSQKLAHLNKFIDLLKNETYELGDLQIRAYQFAGKDANTYRTAVFKLKDKYYECTAAVKPPQTKEILNEVFSTQNAVLKSIKN